ncbi:hypothetical protein EJ08DRAFT_703660 [Tothia fuscella]|uniref:Uncharacterized protein n=1 Tax=Tothia fuscella TaxID=1048955 RepID=A0A9P4NE83_9PEZI|nr:hypothetical protein EJ08DRAFT_703660 [Tothia fuscella]
MSDPPVDWSDRVRRKTYELSVNTSTASTAHSVASPGLGLLVSPLDSEDSEMIEDSSSTPTTPRSPIKEDVSSALLQTTLVDNDDSYYYPSPNGTFKQFSDLTRKVLFQIFDHLPTKADQLTLTLLTKKTYNTLIPKLYHTITVDMSQYPSLMSRFSHVMSSDTFDWQCVRRIVFDATIIVDIKAPPAGLHYLASFFADGCPKERLEYFSWPAGYPLTSSLSLELWDNHPGLQNLEIYQQSLLDNTVDVKNALSKMSSVKSLRLSPSNSDGLKHISSILKNMRTIKHFHVDLLTNADANSAFTDLTVPSLLFKSIKFTHPLQLTHLKLWGAPLQKAKGWINSLDLSTLQELELIFCPSTGVFLKELSQTTPAGASTSTSLRNIRSLKIKYHYNSKIPSYDIVEGLNLRFKKFVADHCQLRTLWLQLIGHGTIPAPELIAALVCNLETLYLDIFDVAPTPSKEALQELNPAILKSFLLKRCVLEQESSFPGGMNTSSITRAVDTILSKTTPHLLHSLAIPRPTSTTALQSLFTFITPVTLKLITYARHTPTAPPALTDEELKIIAKGGRRLQTLADEVVGYGKDVDRVRYYTKVQGVLFGRKKNVMMWPTSLRELYGSGMEVSILTD